MPTPQVHVDYDGKPVPQMMAWNFDAALLASDQARESQDTARSDRIAASEDLANKERAYRVELAKEILRQGRSIGSWSACENIARGQEHIADLRFERDLARGVYEASQERAWRHQADRRDVEQMIQWSRVANPSGA